MIAGFERFAGNDSIDAVQAGQLLLSELNCSSCHTSSSSPAINAPALQAAGLRLHSQWMFRFIQSPQAIKPGTTMPDVMGHLKAEEKRQAARAIVAFVQTQRRPYTEIKATGVNPIPHRFWERGNAEHGAELYHQVGCVACHAPDESHQGSGSQAASADDPLAQLLEDLEPEELAELGLADIAANAPSVPHANLTEKYTQIGLTRFLLDPLSVRPRGRMPNMKLSAVEAADLAAYLLERDAAATTKPLVQTPDVELPDAALPDAALIAQGKKWFVQLRCIQCHAVDGVETPVAPPAMALRDLRSLDAADCTGRQQENVPRFALSDPQKAAIVAALQDAGGTAGDISASEAVQMEMLRQNCYACHRRDSIGGVGRDRREYFATEDHIDLGDEGRLPPPLTDVGRKLTGSWMSKVLAGKKADVRGYMLARMPVFASDVTKHLPASFVAADQPAEATAEEVFGNTANLADAGRQLMDTGCVQCHAFGGQSLPGVRGIDIGGIGGRVHPQWFADFVLNPGKLKPRTRMPTFLQNGESQDKHLLGGDSKRQIAAMWTYLNHLDSLPLPEKVETARATNYELIPTTQPIVLRTFMREAGPHAIAVGFPAKVHVAYDALDCRPALLWRDRFLDAEGTWFVRFTPPADPLGSGPVKLPTGFPIVSLGLHNDESPSAAKAVIRFDGYRLDSSGTPTFLSHGQGLRLSERWEPFETGMKRTLSISGFTADAVVEDLAIRIHRSASLTIDSKFAASDESGLRITLRSTDLEPQQRTLAGQQEWLLPVDKQVADGTPQTIVVQYSW